MQSKMDLSVHSYTFSLLYLLKSNELAKEFVNQKGIEKIFSRYLDRECLEDFQIAYNVICALWIISAHGFALPKFEDFSVRVLLLTCPLDFDH
jgi:hypothetical protein